MRTILKGWKRYLCLLMVMVLLATSIGGCGKKKSVEAPEETQQTVEDGSEVESSSESVTEKPTQKETEKPTQKETEKPTQKETEETTQKETEKPTQKETEKPTQKETEKPTQKETEETTQKVVEETTQKATEESTQKPTEESTQKPTEKPSEQPSETPSEQPSEKPSEQPSETPSEQPSEQPSETPSEQPSETPSETPSEEPTVSNYIVALYDGDTKLKEVEKAAGTALTDISAPYVDEKIFLGWYYDKSFTQKISEEDLLSRNLTLYGKYGEGMPLNEEGSPNYLSATDQNPDFTIIVDTHTAAANVRAVAANAYASAANVRAVAANAYAVAANAGAVTVSADDVKAALLLTNITNPSRTDDSDTSLFLKDELVVTSLGDGRFEVKAKNGFSEGDTYQLEIIGSDKVPDLTFDGETSAVVYYNFTIKREEILNLSLDSEVKYLSASDAKLSKEDAEKIMSYAGLYEAVSDPETGETVYRPTNAFGTFTYERGAFTAGDIVAVYEGTKPDDRTLETQPGDEVAYIEITKVETKDGITTYSYKSAESKDVLFTPDVLPIDIDAGDGVTDWTVDGTSFTIVSSKLDFTTGYEDMGLDYTTVVEPGDFVAFYSGDFGNKNATAKGYGRIDSIEEENGNTIIQYTIVTNDEVLASMDVYSETELTEEQLNSIDTQLIEASVKQQVIESGFAEEAGMYLATMALQTDEVKEMLGETGLELKDCIITYEDGTPVPTDELMLMDGSSVTRAGTPDVNVSVSRNLVHFANQKSGFRVEVAITYGFDVRNVHIEMTAIFETEILLSFSASGGAVWKVKWIFPYIYDYEMSGSITQGLYTGIAITATATLVGSESTFGPEMLEPEGLDDYAQKIVDLSESIQKMMEAFKEEEEGLEGTASGGLVEKYQRFINSASDEWIDLVSYPLFETSGSLDPYYITAYSVNIDLVISANMTVAIGMSFQYEKAQRYSFTLRLFHKNESSSKTIDISPEHYQFDFYVMGKMGIRAGIRAKVLFGLFSTKLAGIGLQVEAGVYAKLWGYFYYCLSWEKGKGKESSATGAMLVEIGAYVGLNLVMEALNGRFSYNPSLYKAEWPLWSAGRVENALDFAYDENGKYMDSKYESPLEFIYSDEYDGDHMLEIPSEIFRMYYMDLKTGERHKAIFDESNFIIEMSNPQFSYDPDTNMLKVDPQGKSDVIGTMTITWKQPDFAFCTKTISRTYFLEWLDPVAKALTFNTNGGSYIRPQFYRKGETIPVENHPLDPEKVGYAFGGWYSDKEFTQKAEIPDIMPDHSVTLYAKWIPIPNEYTVRYFYENLNTRYDLADTVLQKYTYSDTHTSTSRIYTDDYLSQEKIIFDNSYEVPHGFYVDLKKTTQEASVAPDGSTVVDIYYTRQIHTVSYEFGEEFPEEEPVKIQYRYEENLYAPNYFMVGYEFVGWNEVDGTIQDKMDDQHLTYTAQWEPNKNTPYYIEYYIKNPVTGKYEMLGGSLGKLYNEGTTGDYISLEDYLLDDKSDDPEMIDVVGYNLQKIVVNGKEAEGTDGKAKITADVPLLVEYYYEGVDFDLTFDTNGGTMISGDVPDHYTHGLALSVSNIEAQRYGYTFNGWLEGDEPVDTITALRKGPITLTADWRPQTSLITLFDEDGKTKLGTARAAYDKVIPSLAAYKIPTKDGYDFAGYRTAEGELYYDKDGNGKVLWNIVGTDIYLKASWTPKKVKISFNLNGGEGTVLPIEGDYLSKYPTLPSANRTGYDFAGWTLEGDTSGDYVTTDMVIQNFEPHTLVAQWTPAADTAYRVECYVETAENAGTYKLKDTYNYQGITETTATVDYKNYNIPGYVFDATIGDNVLSAPIAADGSTALKLYYKQGKYCTVTFNYGDVMPSETKLLVEGSCCELPSHENVNNWKLTGWNVDGLFLSCGNTYQLEKDVEFTAVWEKATYQVSYRNNAPNSTWEDFEYQTLTYDTPSKAMNNLFSINEDYDEETGKTYYYEFKGWNTEKDGSGTTYMPGDELYNLTFDDEHRWNGAGLLYAQWEKKEVPEGMIPYYVEYNIEDSSGMHRAEDRLKLYGKEGEMTQAIAYEFENLTAQPFEQKVITQTEKSGDEGTYIEYTTITITYDRDRYKLTWDFNGGSIDENSYYTSGETVLGYVLSTPPNPTKDGYEFLGWSVDIPYSMPAHDITAVAQYKETGLYPVTVEYYMENLDGTYSGTPTSTETVYGKLDKAFTPQPATFTGFVAPEAQTITVSAEGDNTVKYYYTRAEYTLSWNPGEGAIADDASYTSGTLKYGAPINAPTLTRAGYEGSWKNFTDTMPAQNVTYTPEWTPKQVDYKVLYYYRKTATDELPTAIVSKGYTALAGSVVTPSVVPVGYENLVAEGYVTPLEQPTVVAGDGSTVIEYYYELIESRLDIDYAGGKALSSSCAETGYYYYGRTLQLAPNSQMKREGFTPVGWYNVNDPERKIVDGIYITIGKEDAVYKMMWKADSYSITYDLVEESATNLNNPSAYVTGADMNLTGARCENKAFLRWEWAGEGAMPEGVKILDNGLVHITSAAKGDLKFRAVWEQKYKLFYATEYKQMPGLPSPGLYFHYYPEGTDPMVSEIPDPVREGYLFRSWTKTVIRNDSYGYYYVDINDDEKISAFNLNRDFVTADWFTIYKDQYKNKFIEVATAREFNRACRYLKEDNGATYAGIRLTADFTLSDLTEPLFDTLYTYWILDGNGHTITLDNCKTSLVNINRGVIKNLHINGTIEYYPEQSEEPSCFGAFAHTNYGYISGCKIVGISGTEDNTRTLISSSADYFGAIAGCNYRIIENCEINDTNIIWDSNIAAQAGRTSGYVGGFAGRNDFDSRIVDGRQSNTIVSVAGGYLGASAPTVYIGGYAGTSQGEIKNCTFANGTIGASVELSDNIEPGNMYAGGFVGIDLPLTAFGDTYEFYMTNREIVSKVRGIYNCTIKGSVIRGEYLAGGLIGECNCSVIKEDNTENIEVYADSYAGNVAGIYRSYQWTNGVKKFKNSRITANQSAGIIAGLLEQFSGFATNKAGDQSLYEMEYNFLSNKISYKTMGDNFVISGTELKAVDEGLWTAYYKIGIHEMTYEFLDKSFIVNWDE